jgi:hypothetical protein
MSVVETVADRAARLAEERCIAGRALKTPLDVRVVTAVAKEVVAA